MPLEIESKLRIPVPPFPAAPAYPGTGLTPTPAPAAAPAPAPAPGPPAPGTARVNNTQFKAIFQPYRDLPTRVRDIKFRLQQNNTPLPTRADGKNRCLAYHVKGICNERCSNAHDHKSASDADDAALLAWCKDHWKE